MSREQWVHHVNSTHVPATRILKQWLKDVRRAVRYRQYLPGWWETKSWLIATDESRARDKARGVIVPEPTPIWKTQA